MFENISLLGERQKRAAMKRQWVIISFSMLLLVSACDVIESDFYPRTEKLVEIDFVGGSAQVSNSVVTYQNDSIIFTRRRTESDFLRDIWYSTSSGYKYADPAFDLAVLALRTELKLSVDERGFPERLPGLILEGPRNPITGNFLLNYGDQILIYCKVKDTTVELIRIDSLYSHEKKPDRRHLKTDGFRNSIFDENLSRLYFKVDNVAYFYEFTTSRTIRIPSFEFVVPIRKSKYYLGYRYPERLYCLLDSSHQTLGTMSGPDIKGIDVAFQLDSTLFAMVTTVGKYFDLKQRCMLLDFEYKNFNKVHDLRTGEILDIRLVSH